MSTCQKKAGKSKPNLQVLELDKLNEMFLHTQPAHLQKLNGRLLDGAERSVARADYLRRVLGSNN